MIATIIKGILSFVQIEASLKEGDQVSIKITLGERVVLDRTLDIIPGA